MFGTTLVARVLRCWQLSLVPCPLGLNSYILSTRVLGTRWFDHTAAKLSRLEAVQRCISQVARIS